MLVVVIYSKQTAGKSSGFTEGYEYGLVYFSARVYLYAYVQQDHTTEHHDSGDDQLGDILGFVFHVVCVAGGIAQDWSIDRFFKKSVQR